MNVLIADDNRDAAESLAIWLRMEGHEVQVVHGGEEALATFDSKPSEVVILDIGMPGLNGYEVAQRIRLDPRGRETTLIAATGWGEADDKTRAFAAGFNHHLTRPIEPDRLAALLRSNGDTIGADESQTPKVAPVTRPAVKDPLSPALLAEVCHDLRGPLGAIGTWVRVLQSERADAATRLRAVTALAGDVRAMGALIDEVSALAEILSGPTNITLAPIDLVPFVRSACVSATEGGAQVSLQVNDASLVAVADAVRLRQLVQLFASMALGAPESRPRTLHLGRRGPTAEFSIETTGTPGALDVTLARALAEVQGGAFEDSLKSGTTFLRLLLPLAS